MEFLNSFAKPNLFKNKFETKSRFPNKAYQSNWWHKTFKLLFKRDFFKNSLYNVKSKIELV